MTPLPARGDVLLLLTALIWGVNFPVSKHVLAHVPPMAYATSRYVLASAVLMALLWWRRGLPRLERRDLLPLAGIGLLGITLFQGLWANALTLTTASKAAIFISTSPIWAALWLALSGRGLRPAALAGVLLSFGGVFLIMNNSVTALTLGGGLLIGDLMFLAIAAIWALYSAVAPPYLARLGALTVTAWTMLLGTLPLLPLGLPGLVALDYGALPGSAWAGFAFAAIFAAALGFLWWYEGLQALGLGRAMLYSYLVPVFAIASAVLFLGEPFSLVQALGTAIVLAGIRLARGA